jgi:hypothetical protein
MMFWHNSLPEIESPQSKTSPETEYVDHTSNLKQCIAGHNAGKCTYTSKSIPLYKNTPSHYERVSAIAK